MSANPNQYIPPIRGNLLQTTLNYMNAIVKRWRYTDSIRDLAASVLFSLQQHDKKTVAATLQKWVQENIKFQRDPVDVEIVSTPDITLKKGYGDCDDMSVLLASMLESVGIDSRFKLISEDGMTFNHVMVEAFIPCMGWVALETILPLPIGAIPDHRRSAVVVFENV